MPIRRLLASLIFLFCAAPIFAQAAPVCVVGVSGTVPTATITFTPPTLNTDGTPIAAPVSYNLYQSTASGTEIKVTSALKGSPIAVTTGLTTKTTFYWKITAVDASGTESALSNEVCKTFPVSVPGVVTITIS